MAKYARTLADDLTRLRLVVAVALCATLGCSGDAQATDRPNILFIMGDDIGLMQVGIYHQGIALGETPNIDRLGMEGGKFTDYYAMQSCTSGRNAFFTGISVADRYDPPATSRKSVLSAAGNSGDRQIPARPRLHHR